MAENTVLEVQELTREFTRRGKPFAAVDHVDFRLGQGEFVAIVGRSGNGKSTLLNLITGLLKPTSGSIDLDGNDVTRLNDKQMSVVRNRIVGFVTQSQTLLPNLTALDNVILPSVLCNGKTAQRDVEIPADSSDAKSVEETVSDASSEQTVDDGLPDVIAAAPVSKTHNDPVQDHAMERAHALLRRLQVDDLGMLPERAFRRRNETRQHSASSDEWSETSDSGRTHRRSGCRKHCHRHAAAAGSGARRHRSVDGHP